MRLQLPPEAQSPPDQGGRAEQPKIPPSVADPLHQGKTPAQGFGAICSLLGGPAAGMTLRRWVGLKAGGAMMQRDIPTVPAGTAYAHQFLQRHAADDLYCTPNLFKNSKGGARTINQLHTACALWLDVDGVPGAHTGGEAWALLADAADELGLPQPNITVCTSEAQDDPTYLPRLQAYFLIEPFYFGTLENRNLWRKAAHELADAFTSKWENHGFGVDRCASSNPAGFMRLPGSVNSKTGTRVHAVGPIHQQRTTCAAILDTLSTRTRKIPTSWKKRPAATSRQWRGRLMNLPQVQILARGVPQQARNLAGYALAKCLYADGLSLEAALAWGRQWNARCTPSEDAAKVEDVFQRAYGALGPEQDAKNFKGISPAIVAQTVRQVTGQPQELDLRFRAWFPHGAARRRCWQPTASIDTPALARAARKRRGFKRLSGLKTWAAIGDRIVRYRDEEHPRGLLVDGATITLAQMARAADVSVATIRRWRGNDLLLRYLEVGKGVVLRRTRCGWEVLKPSSRQECYTVEPPPTMTSKTGTQSSVLNAPGAGVGPPGGAAGGGCIAAGAVSTRPAIAKGA